MSELKPVENSLNTETVKVDLDSETTPLSSAPTQETPSEEEEKQSLLTSPEPFVNKQLPQYLAAFAGAIGGFGLGNVLGWASPALVSIGDHHGTGLASFHAKSEEASWVASISNLGALAACLTMGFPMEFIGRKWSMVAVSIPFLVGWLILGFAQNLAMLLIGRFITGYCGGAFTLVFPVYVSEISEAKIRGILGNLLNVVIGLGILTVYTLGAFVQWNILSLILGAFPVLLFIGLLFVPDSPQHLLFHGKEAKALKSLKQLRGAKFDYQVEEEFNSIRQCLVREKKVGVSCKEIFTKKIMKPVTISMTLMFLQQFGGITAVFSFAGVIFKDSKTGVPDNCQPIFIGVMLVISVIISTIVVDRIGRVILLTFSGAGMGLSLIPLGVYFYLKEFYPAKAEDLGWLPMTCLIVYIACFNVGIGPLAWVIMGEIMPPRVLTRASSMAAVFNWLLAFIISKTFAQMTTTMHEYGCYWFFSAISIVGTFFCFFIVPETRGRSLDEIQELF